MKIVKDARRHARPIVDRHKSLPFQRRPHSLYVAGDLFPMSVFLLSASRGPPPPGHATQVAVSDQLGQDANGNLRHSLRTNVDAERSIDVGERLRRNALRFEIVENQLDLSLAAD